MNTYQIVVLSGDGIGPEIVDGALQVLEMLQKQVGRFRLEYTFYEAGAVCFQNTGEPISAQALKAIETADATFKGPTGLPDVRKPDGTEAGMLGGVLRNGFDLYANLRPIRLFPTRPPPSRIRPRTVLIIISCGRTRKACICPEVWALSPARQWPTH